MIATICFVAWWVFGLVGWVLWHTRDNDLTAEDLISSTMFAFFAPWPWMFMAIDALEGHVLIKCRSR
jgi:hypothetical protein